MNKGKLPPLKQEEPIAYRALSFRADAANETERSIPVTLATGEGVKTFDFRRGMVDEYLLMDGAKLPKQVPLVDSHNHDSVRNILGSIRDLKVDGNELTGVAYFGAKPVAVEAFNDIRDGHLTDISVGAFRLKETYIEAEKEGEVSGRKVRGPARLVTRWQPFEGSAVTVGADRHSTFGRVPALRAYFDPDGAREDAMNESFRALLESLGMPKETGDEAALVWAKDNLGKIAERAAPEVKPVVAAAVPEVTPAELDAIQRANAERTKLEQQKLIDDAAKRAAEAELQRGTTIRSLVAMANVDAKLADELIASRADIPNAAKKIQEAQAIQRQAIGIKPVGSEHESFRAAALDGFAQRLNWRPAAGEKLAPGHAEFRGMRFLDLTRKAMEMEGVSTRGLSDRDLISRAFAQPATIRASDGQAYHTTGNFANLLLDASNKVLLKAYAQTETTWQRWARNAGTTPDLKLLNRTRLGEVGNLPMVPENDDYKDLAMSDSKESYRPYKHGAIVSLTWETMINDDLNAFARLVQLQGNAAARTVDKAVYQVFFDNRVMSDTGALFNSTAVATAGGHNNLHALDISVANLNTMWNAFMLQPGLNSDVTLGLEPKYLLCAPLISGTAYQFINSTADPAAGGSAAGNANTDNIYGPGGPRRLTVIPVHWLAGNDTNSFYLAADHSSIDTVEVTFLEGEETPAFEQESAFRQDAVLYKVRQTFGTDVIDWRGLAKSTGSS